MPTNESSLIKKEEIQKIINELNSCFNNDFLIKLFRNISNNTFIENKEKIDLSYFSNFDDSIFSDPILIGSFEIEEGKICILSIKTKKELNEKSGKKKQYDIAKSYLKIANEYVGGFFIFYDENSNFRFSFVYDIPIGGGKRAWSNFRRYTYFVSRYLTNRTFIEQFSSADFKSLNGIIDAFSIEKVTEEFYQQIANWYFWAIKESKFPDDGELIEKGRNDAVIRLITRLIFIWFMKEKKIIPELFFDFNSIKNILKGFDLNGINYYKAILQNLFFAALNNQSKDEKKFCYPEEFNNKDEILNIFKKIPFLNGGLFECLDMPKDDPENDYGRNIYIDGFCEYPDKQPKIPNYLFFGYDYPVNLSQDYNDNRYTNSKANGIINILKSYNFTIDENSLVDQEVALDPELLGKVFENLLASYNPETATTARKTTGSFYTPRQIVDFMVEQSLKQYFLTVYKDKIKNIEEKLDQLFDINIENNPFNEEESNILISLIEKIKILDPAVGSGAFLMGALHKLTYILSKIDPHNEKWKSKNIEIIEKEIQDPILLQNFIKKIEEDFNENELDYGRKLYLIKDCLCGVDIQQIAIQIAKLRFFISLLVEQKIDFNKDNFGIQPLPNLETKLVCADTLIHLENEKEKEDYIGHLFEATEYLELENRLLDIRKKYFDAFDPERKRKYKEEDKNIRLKIVSKYNEENKKNLAEQTYQKILKIARWDPYKINSKAEWFDPEWMFGVRNGFDIVLGNPPYISTKGIDKDFKEILNKNYGFSDDTYNHFYFRGIELLKYNGILAYISSKTFWTIQTKKNLRELLLKNSILQIFDTANPFASAMVDTCVTIVQKQTPNKNHLITFLDGRKNLVNPACYTVLQNIYSTAPNKVFFIPADHNMKVYEQLGKKVNELLNQWWDSISTSKNIEKNKNKLEEYRKYLKPGDITLLGLITEGGQGLATANNGKYIGVLECTKWAEKVKEERPEKLLLISEFCNKQNIKNKNDAQKFLDNFSEKEIRKLFDDLKEKYGRDVFGQGWLYRIVSKDEIADVETLTDDEKLNGIAGTRTFVPYDKGDKEGNRWYAPTPYYIDWSRENVKFLKDNSGKKGEGMPVVRNPQFYFREGFCWKDIGMDILKVKYKEKTINDVKSMSLYPIDGKLLKYFISLLNSRFMSYYQFNFINNTVSIQINDIRQIPIVIPTHEQLKQFEDIFDRAYNMQKQKFEGMISERESEEMLIKIQNELDKLVDGIYIEA